MVEKFPKSRTSAQIGTFRKFGDIWPKARVELNKVGITPDKLIKLLDSVDVNTYENFAIFSKDLYPNMVALILLLKYMNFNLNAEVPSHVVVDGSFLGDMWFNNDDVPEEMRHKFVTHSKILFVYMSEMSFSYRRFNNILKDVYSSREKDGKKTILIFKGNYSQYKENEGDLNFFDKVFELDFKSKNKKTTNLNKSKSSSHSVGRIV